MIANISVGLFTSLQMYLNKFQTFIPNHVLIVTQVQQILSNMNDIDQLAEQMGLIKIESQNPQPQVVVLYDRETLKHHSTKAHPENPTRLEKILENLKQKDLLTNGKVKIIDSLKPIDRDLIVETHGQNYTEFVLNMWPEDDKRKQIYINVDTYIMKDTVNCALLAAGGVIEAVDEVLQKNNSSAFAIVRPPGHHAGLKSQPHGFCYLNNVALGAKYVQKKFKKQKILILDWDAHHGEGTQNIFYETDNVMYASLHRYDNANFFPHIKESGPQNVGKSKGVGYNINIGWNVHQEPYQTCGDKQYVYAFQRLLLPVFKQYNPDFIFISCGFDSGCDDPIGGLEVTAKGYQYMTYQMKEFGVPMVVVLEGGYNFQTLKWGSQAVLKTLLGDGNKDEIEKLKKQYVPNRVAIDAVQTTIQYLKGNWQLNTSQLLVQQNKKLKQFIKSFQYQHKKPQVQQSKQKSKPKPNTNTNTNPKEQKSNEKKQQVVSTNTIIKPDYNQSDTVSVGTVSSTGPMTRAKTKQIEKQQQI